MQSAARASPVSMAASRPIRWRWWCATSRLPRTRRKTASRARCACWSRVSRVQQEWRPVAGYGGRYEVADDGRVRSVSRTLKGSYRGTRRFVGRELQQVGVEVARVALVRDRQLDYQPVAALVLTAFVGPALPGATPRHRDGNT